MASRLIVKNLPRHLTEERLREHFSASGDLTDCRLKKTKDGRSRQFAFIGFRTGAEAKAAVERFHRSFLDTARLSVELAHEPGSEALARPWSRYAAGSSARLRRDGRGKQRPPSTAADETGKPPSAGDGTPGARAAEAEGQVPRPVRGAKGVRTARVAPGKAGVASRRTHVEFASSGEESAGEGAEEAELQPRQQEGAAFDESLSDLAYLRKKVAAPEPAAEGPPGRVQPVPDDATAPRGAPEPPAAGVGDPPAVDGEEPGLDDLGSTGRLYVTNIPYGASEEELRAHFGSFGEVSSAVVCKDEDTLKPRGFGYVSYAFPECAVRALAASKLRAFQGRLLGVVAARARQVAEAAPGAGASGTSSYKRKKREQQRKVEAHLEHTWNLLYVSANAAADAASAQLGLAKNALVGKDAEGAAVTAALTETSVVQQTKRWLRREGIRVDAFEQSGASLAQSRAKEGGRRDDTLVVKHLPAGASTQELRERFARHGELARCTLAPSGTVAIMQYSDPAHAKHAFGKLAFSRYRHSPLYLEWAPADLFTEGAETAAGASGEEAEEAEVAAAEDSRAAGVTAAKGSKGARRQAKGREAPAGAEAGGAGGEGADGEAGGVGASLFVKNLSFETTDQALEAAFRGCKGFRSAVVMKKEALGGAAGARGAEAKRAKSMGYGFVEFDGAAGAAEALRRKQGLVLDGHAVQLQLSQRRGQGRAGAADVAKGGTKSKTLSTQRLCVRNLAFEATAKELRQLFGAYGSVTAVRIPKKGDYTGHRGFAFLDFASRSEAAAAYEALQHTHLYGRRLVIEPAEERTNDVEAVQVLAAKRQTAKELKSEAKRRRTAGVFNAAKDAGSFQDAVT